MSDFKAFLLNTTPLQRLIAGALILIVTGALIFRFAYKPQRDLLDMEIGHQKQYSQSLSSQENEIQNLKGAMLTNLAVQQKHRDTLQVQLNKLFTKDSMEQFIRVDLEQLAIKSKVTIDKGPDEDLSSTSPVLISPENKSVFQAMRRPVHFSLSCDYPKLDAFLETLFKYNHYLQIADMTVSSMDFTGDLEVDMTLYLYYEEGS